MPPARIEICGGIASGKTTLSCLLASIGVSPVLEEFHKNPFLRHFYLAPERYGFETELVFLVQHYSQVKNFSERTAHACDFSFVLDEAYAKTNLKGGQLAVFSNLLRHLRSECHEPALLIYLQCSPECEYERIRSRGREQEKNVSLDYLKALNAELDRMVEKAAMNGVLAIDSEHRDFATVPEVQAEVCRIIAERLGLSEKNSQT